jgi:hypothetical protein
MRSRRPEPEEWRPVKGWPYEVSNQGRVRYVGSVRRHLIRKLTIKKSGYVTVNLTDGGSPCRRHTFKVNTLVCAAFHGPATKSRWHAAHWNGKRADNRALNLRWATPKENSADCFRHGTALLGERAPASKLTAKQVIEIRHRHARGETLPALAAAYGVSWSTVQRANSRQTWRCIA